MSFSVTCSDCDRRFVDIDESLIGQKARCRCGSIVELDPVWDSKRGKTNRRPNRPKRPGAPRRPAKAGPAKVSEPTKRRSTNANAAQPAKKQPSADRPSDPRRKKRRPQKTQPTAVHAIVVPDAPAEEPKTQVESKTQVEPSSPSETKSSDGALFDSYADLDQILAAGVDHTPLEPTRVDSPFEKPKEETAKPSRRGLIGAGIGGLAGLVAALFLLVTRVSAFGGTPLGWSGQAFYGTYTASYGSGEMTNACTSLFMGIGWWILFLAVLLGIASGLLLARVAIRIAADRKVLAWSRGLLATLSVVCLFSLMGMLFVQNIHHGNLIRDLDSFSNSAPIDGLLEPVGQTETFQDVRENYATENTDFMIGVLTFAVLPLISFVGIAASLLLDER